MVVCRSILPPGPVCIAIVFIWGYDEGTIVSTKFMVFLRMFLLEFKHEHTNTSDAVHTRDSTPLSRTRITSYFHEKITTTRNTFLIRNIYDLFALNT